MNRDLTEESNELAMRLCAAYLSLERRISMEVALEEYVPHPEDERKLAKYWTDLANTMIREMNELTAPYRAAYETYAREMVAQGMKPQDYMCPRRRKIAA